MALFDQLQHKEPLMFQDVMHYTASLEIQLTLRLFCLTWKISNSGDVCLIFPRFCLTLYLSVFFYNWLFHIPTLPDKQVLKMPKQVSSSGGVILPRPPHPKFSLKIETGKLPATLMCPCHWNMTSRLCHLVFFLLQSLVAMFEVTNKLTRNY